MKKRSRVARGLCTGLALMVTFSCTVTKNDKTNPVDTVGSGLAGSWQITYPNAVVITTFFADNSFEQSMNGAAYLQGEYSTDNRQSPYHLNLTFTHCIKEDSAECPPLNRVFACYIYHIDGDTLILAHDCETDIHSRPAAFTDDCVLEKAVRLEK